MVDSEKPSMKTETLNIKICKILCAIVDFYTRKKEGKCFLTAAEGNAHL
jgi:hypothetical protein